MVDEEVLSDEELEEPEEDIDGVKKVVDEEAEEFGGDSWEKDTEE